MSDIAISVKNLGKEYQIGHQESYATLNETISKKFAGISRKISRSTNQISPETSCTETFWALRDISFDVPKGEIIGVIGRNGAGKSTLLKILSRITSPSEGIVEIHGRIGSLLEVGTGFHPELTGRENIYLNGSILGMKRSEIDQKFDEIVKFSEIEKFLDTPVKRYSSGMYVRLAFAVAANMDTDILLVDEVLAVGDTAFQKKSLGKMEDVAKEGRTVLFVSHNMGAMSSLCSQGFLLDHGNLIFSGKISDVISRYTGDSQSADVNTWIGNEGDDNVRLLKTWVLPLNDSGLFITSSDIEIGIEIQVCKQIEGLIAGFALHSSFGYELAYTLYDDVLDPPSELITQGKYIFKFIIPKNTLSVGIYQIIFDVGIHMKKRIIHSDGGIKFRLENYDGIGRRFPVQEVRGRASLFRPKWFSSSNYRE